MSVLLSFFEKSPREKGTAAERVAVEFLNKKGWRILETNYHTRRGEIDIIGQDGDQLAFVEVKSAGRASDWYVGDRIDQKKRKRIELAARQFISTHEIPAGGIRFDAVIMIARPNGEWSIEHIKDAFRIEDDA